MKKSILLVFAMLLGTSMIFAQPFEKGNHAINLGIGFGNTGYLGAGYKGFIPSISGSYEYGIVEIPMGAELKGVVGVGGYIGWATSRYEYTYWNDLSYHYNSIYFGARGNYHFIFMDKLDTYAGIWLGYKVVNGKWKGSGTVPSDWNATSSSVAGGAYVGARWYFTDTFAAYAELGYLISVFNIGVTFKIPGK